MRLNELEKKAQLLKAGQVVEIAGDFFRAVKVNNPAIVSCCQLCQLDSICRDDVFDVCCQMETLTDPNWLLELAHPL